MPLLTLLKIIYYFVQDDSQRRILRTLNLNASLVSQICRRLQDVCFLDLQTRPVIPFGGPGAVVKCDESKFNHKAKVNVMIVCCLSGNLNRENRIGGTEGYRNPSSFSEEESFAQIL